MESIVKIIDLIENAFRTPTRAFALGLVFSAVISYFIYNSVLDENQRLKTELTKAHDECLNRIREVKNFLKEVAQ